QGAELLSPSLILGLLGFLRLGFLRTLRCAGRRHPPRMDSPYKPFRQRLEWVKANQIRQKRSNTSVRINLLELGGWRVIPTYEVERGKSDARYSPYCNGYPFDEANMTDEHVIPQSMGGDRRTVIRTCKGCNSKTGHVVDDSISRYSFLRAVGISCGNQ